MESPVAKIIMLAATIAITAAVVLATWNIVGVNTPDPNGKVTDKTQIKHQALCEAVDGKWSGGKCS
ncbi:MAG: hypothetical protein OXD37_07670 [Acidimicrobiaceae bacterium]|nr:hypothetical protein [Acidimicrobiaceae bacterium]